MYMCTLADRHPQGANYIVIDINYFPGYEKLPDYENLMSTFLAQLFSKGPERQLYRFVSCREQAGAQKRSRPASSEGLPVHRQ